MREETVVERMTGASRQADRDAKILADFAGNLPGAGLASNVSSRRKPDVIRGPPRPLFIHARFQAFRLETGFFR
jgi:hypothetical protein